MGIISGGVTFNPDPAYATSPITLDGIIVTGTITSSSYGSNVGGLIGDAGGGTNAIATRVSFDGRINAPLVSEVGGIFGYGSGSIAQGSATGSVTGLDRVSGRAKAPNGAITDSYSQMSVTATGTRPGDQYAATGFSARLTSRGSISDSYAAGTVTGTEKAGFIAWWEDGGTPSGGTVSNSFFDNTLAPPTDTAPTGVLTVTVNPPLSRYAGSNLPSLTPTSTATMKTASTYSLWSSSIWNLTDGSYPTLK